MSHPPRFEESEPICRAMSPCLVDDFDSSGGGADPIHDREPEGERSRRDFGCAQLAAPTCRLDD
ncbi:MAG: hypothetical protein AAGC67_02965 [Myxococcota bacterium]